MSFSQIKLCKIDTIRHWKMKIRQLKREDADNELMNNKKVRRTIEAPNQITAHKAKKILKREKEDWVKYNKKEQNREKKIS